MAYKTASQKILVWLFIITLAITIVSGAYWKMWSIVPITFFMLWLAGKFIAQIYNLLMKGGYGLVLNASIPK